MDITKDIIKIVNNWMYEIPNGFKAFQKEEKKNIIDILHALIKLFKEEEKELQNRRLEGSISDGYEKQIINFAAEIAVLLVWNSNNLLKYSDYRMLLKQKYIAYSIYDALSKGTVIEEYLPDTPYIKRDLYMGMVDFFDNYYENFNNNERAIELLCRYYPKKINMGGQEEKIAIVLYKHVLSAGTIYDKGYSYRGIHLIQEYIGELSSNMIFAILSQYRRFEIINNSVYRQQIFTIINYSVLEEKHKIKFDYLDFIMLSNTFNQYLQKKFKKNGVDVKPYYDRNYRLGNKKIQIFNIPDVYWNVSIPGEKILHIYGRKIIRIKLNKNMVECIYKKKIEMEYFYDDWRLDRYHSRETENMIWNFILEMDSEFKYHQMLFSMVYLDQYRGIRKQCIDFDHRFIYMPKSRQVEYHKASLDQIPHFYGESVYSLTCIVGKNGTGKTSAIDFLRESFFKLLRLIDENEIICEKGYVDEKDYLVYGILDKDVQFLVIFLLDECPFFITNIKDVVTSKVTPFENEIYLNINEFCKIAYFSNMLSNHQDNIFSGYNVKRKDDRYQSEKQGMTWSLNTFKQTDYSERESFVRRCKGIRLMNSIDITTYMINREICYQFSFLKKSKLEELCGLLDINEQQKFEINSCINEWKGCTFGLKDFLSKIEELEREYIVRPDARIQYFSSGQYAKFSFLAKLYWFLNGYNEDAKRYGELTDYNLFSREEALEDGETALIFIDEGEVFYHPEWQRQFIKILLDMVNQFGIGRKIQIIITTNSPFMLSDLLPEDVTYLFDNRKEKKGLDGTLGQNIHRLLRENFFMEYTIGEYARDIIEDIMLCLDNQEENYKNKIKERIKIHFGENMNLYSGLEKLIKRIAEPVYRYNLEKQLKYSKLGVDEHIQALKREKMRLEEEIIKLEKDKREK